LFALAIPVRAIDTIDYPFQGVRHIHRAVTAPRLLNMDIVEIDLTTPGLSFQTTESNKDMAGKMKLETTRAFVDRFHAQIGVNANFFDNSDKAQASGYTTLHGLAVSNGNQVSPWIVGNASSNCGVNISMTNQVTFIAPAPGDTTGYLGQSITAPHETITSYNAIAGIVWLIRDGIILVKPDGTLHPRTALAKTADNKLLLFTVDGRQPDWSLGMDYAEMAVTLKEFGAVLAVNMDGGGSTTLIFSDTANGAGRLVNRPPYGLLERRVGNNLAVFARYFPPSIKGVMPENGAIGTSVTISGTHFQAITAISFNGTPATFTVDTAGQITASVPAGASTGPIRVTGAGGSATSPAYFRCLNPLLPPKPAETRLARSAVRVGR